MKRLFPILFLFFSFAYSNLIVEAQCRCAGLRYEEGNSRRSRYETAYQEFQNSSSVFVGKVIDVKKVKIKSASKSETDHIYKVKFEVEKSWKTNTPKEIVVTEGSGCILGFKEGEQYLVYASFSKGILWTSFCSRTRKLVYADEDLREFEEKGEKLQDLVGRINRKQ
jgi:hypothetical protein